MRQGQLDSQDRSSVLPRDALKTACVAEQEMRLPAAVHGVRVTNHAVSDERQARLPVPVKMIACLRLSHLTLARRCFRGGWWNIEAVDANGDGACRGC